MSATMARQGGQLQLEQSDMRVALNVAKMANGGFSLAAIEETQQLIQKQNAEVCEQKKRGVEFPGHEKVKVAIERNMAMVYKNHPDGCVACYNGTGKHPQTRWRSKGTGAPPPDLMAPSPGMPHLSGMPPVQAGDTDGNESYEIEGMPTRCVYIHSPHPNSQFFNYNAYAMDSKHDKDFIPDLLSTLSAA